MMNIRENWFVSDPALWNSGFRLVGLHCLKDILLRMRESTLWKGRGMQTREQDGFQSCIPRSRMFEDARNMYVACEILVRDVADG